MPDVDAPIHPFDQRIQQEIVGTESGDGGILYVVQLLPGSPDSAGDTRDGSRLDGPCLDGSGTARSVMGVSNHANANQDVLR